MCSSRHCFADLALSLVGGGGNSTLDGPYGLTPVFGTGDFSNSSTPPHSKNLERRRGIEPRTPRLQLGRSPHRRQPGCMVRLAGFEPAPVRLLRSLPLQVGLQALSGRLGRIRTDTGHGLSVLPLPSWATSLWCSGRDSNSQQCGPQLHASTVCATRTLVGSQGFEPRRSQRDTASTARRFRPLSQLPKCKLSKIWRKAGNSNAYVPRDPGLADQWDTNYPSLPGTT
jgi:hypothetical protein